MFAICRLLWRPVIECILTSGFMEIERMTIPRTFLLLLTLAASGCFPYHYTTRPGINGTVLSAATGQPILQAGVTLSGANTTTSTATAGDGSFSIPPCRRWGIWIIPQDVFASRWTVCVGHSGFKTNCTDFLFKVSATGEAAQTNLGVISLQLLHP
jgi:hypothetical protein